MNDEKPAILTKEQLSALCNAVAEQRDWECLTWDGGFIDGVSDDFRVSHEFEIEAWYEMVIRVDLADGARLVKADGPPYKGDDLKHYQEEFTKVCDFVHLVNGKLGTNGTGTENC